MDYQRKNLADQADIGDAGPVPANIANLDDASLADLSSALGATAAGELGYAGHGFFPMMRKVSALAFKQRLTGQERIAIRAAGETDPLIADFLDLLASASTVDLDHADTVNGCAYLVALTLLTQDRADEIRA